MKTRTNYFTEPLAIMGTILVAGLIAMAVIGAEPVVDPKISTKAPHICSDCQSAIHTR